MARTSAIDIELAGKKYKAGRLSIGQYAEFLDTAGKLETGEAMRQNAKVVHWSMVRADPKCGLTLDALSNLADVGEINAAMIQILRFSTEPLEPKQGEAASP